MSLELERKLTAERRMARALKGILIACVVVLGTAVAVGYWVLFQLWRLVTYGPF